MIMKKVKRTGKLLLIDYNNIMHKSIHVNSRLTYKGKFTGGVYGFIRQLISTAEDFSVNHIIACKDSPPYIRKELFPDYKANRPKNDEVFFMKMTQTKSFIDEFLYLSGIQLEEHQGFEADDIVAKSCELYNFKFNKIYVKSNDDDLYQLLRFKNITLLRNKGSKYTYDDFINEYDITPLDWIKVNALRGSHNNIPGIKGVGIKTALKIVKDIDLWDKYYADYEQMIELNKKLIKLPYGNLSIPIKKLSYNRMELIKFLRNTGIRISITEIENLLRRLM